MATTTTDRSNRQVILAKRPTTSLEESHFAIRAAPVPVPGSGEVLVRNIYSSVEPYLRILMSHDTAYGKKLELGSVVPARVVGEVVQSRHPELREGDHVYGMLRWEDYSLADAGSLRRVDATLAPLSAYVGVLGTSGLTAYIGMLEVGDPQPGENVYVSAAAGAVGQLAGQLAKLRGARVVGSAGTDEKIAYIVEELAFDDAFNYRKVDNLTDALKEKFPNGIDLDFENVGGPNLDAVLECISIGARIVMCGNVSQYNEASPYGIRNITSLVLNRARILGFSVRDHHHRMAEYIARMSQWLREGRIKYRQTISPGLETAPHVLVGMMRGGSIGKQILQIGEDTSGSASRANAILAE